MMSDIENNGIDIIPPLLRGIYHAFCCSVRVRTLQASPAEITIDLPEPLLQQIKAGNKAEKTAPQLSDSLSTFIHRAKEAIGGYYKRENRLPGTLSIADNLYSIETITKTIATKQENSSTAYTSEDNLSGKIALVTGAAQGIGLGIAKRLVGKGMMVFLADINESQVEQAAHAIHNQYNNSLAKALHIDVSDQRSIQAAAEKLCREAGGLDILLSNAGISKSGSLESLSYDDFSRINEVNYTGFYLLVKYFSPFMKLQNCAHRHYSSDIIQINSKSGLRGSMKNFAYAGSKFAGIGLTQSFALELAPHYIKVNAICPGNFFSGPLWSDPKQGLLLQFLKEGKVPGAKTTDDVLHYYLSRSPLGSVLGRGCTVDDITQAVLYAITQQYETGQAIPVTGGQELLS